MRNKKLIPFEVIQKAVAGEPEAVDAVLRYYNAHIKYLSMYKGHINDDTQDRLKAKLVEAILKFRFDRPYMVLVGLLFSKITKLYKKRQ